MTVRTSTIQVVNNVLDFPQLTQDSSDFLPKQEDVEMFSPVVGMMLSFAFMCLVLLLVCRILWWVLNGGLQRLAWTGPLPTEKAEFDLLAKLRQEQNMLAVEGWQYALRESIITTDDLRYFDSETLQNRIDSGNPFAAELMDVLERIPAYQGATSRRDKRRHDKLVTYRKQLREQPMEIHRKAIAPSPDSVLNRACQAIQSVQNLSEG